MSKLMLVEDDHLMISLLRTLLEIEGFEIVEFDLAEDLNTAVQRENPDLILLDVHLRDPNGREVNGFELLKGIRQEPAFDSIKVIVSSGLNFVEKSQEAGANGFIHKPYMPVDLIKIIKENIA